MHLALSEGSGASLADVHQVLQQADGRIQQQHRVSARRSRWARGQRAQAEGPAGSTANRQSSASPDGTRACGWKLGWAGRVGLLTKLDPRDDLLDHGHLRGVGQGRAYEHPRHRKRDVGRAAAPSDRWSFATGPLGRRRTTFEPPLGQRRPTSASSAAERRPHQGLREGEKRAVRGLCR